jgi:D-glycero-alpha-D-manno-heptose-7-phosphate kinase
VVISRTPVRISFFGGGTDYPAYYRRCGGETLVTAIDKFLTISVHHLTQFFDHKIQIHYSRIESVQAVKDIQLSAARETLQYLGITEGVEVHLVADLPARTGTGSSSAATVGLLTALHAYLGHVVGEEQIAAEAVHIEQERIGERVGSQDQYACAIGGFQHLQFHENGAVTVRPVTIAADRLAALQERLMLFYTGIQRTAHDVVKSQLDSTATGALDSDLAKMRSQVRRGISILSDGSPLRDFGELLHEGWELKRGLSGSVSTSYIDALYSRARESGAIGGKLLGAGGGGFILLFAEPEDQAAIRSALSELREVKFRFEPQGTRVAYFRPSLT